MPNINVSEADFDVLAKAALDALENGEHEQAAALDKMARKLNAKLSRTATLRGWPMQGKPLGWEDVPSVLDLGI